MSPEMLQSLVRDKKVQSSQNNNFTCSSKLLQSPLRELVFNTLSLLVSSEVVSSKINFCIIKFNLRLITF